MPANVDPRPTAVRAIADAIADRTSFVLTVPPYAVPTLHERLALLPAWTVYLDTGLDAVFRAENDPRLLQAVTALNATLGVPIVGVALVPKIVPAKRLARALGQEIPADGSRDVIVVAERGGGTAWPQVFVDALDQVDPVAAAQIRAASVD